MQLLDTGEPVVLAFPTPVFRHTWPDHAAVDAGLKRLILARRGQQSSTRRSNVGGWQSSHDFMSWGSPEIKQLGGWLNEAFGAVMEKQLGTRAFNCRLSVTAWANVNTHGSYNRHHTHANNHWSAVYYVDLGEPDPAIRPNGAIEFIDPRPAIDVYALPGVAGVSTWTIEPTPGMMLMFPSWLRHGVLPFYGTGERISIAFNLRVGELKLQGQSGTGAPALFSAT